MQKPIVVVGSVTMDMVSRARNIPLIGQTVIGTGFETTPGGKGANQAVAAARLGYPVKMVGLVGEDVYGPALLENLRPRRRWNRSHGTGSGTLRRWRRFFLRRMATTPSSWFPGQTEKLTLRMSTVIPS